jgi:hypothetical protein
MYTIWSSLRSRPLRMMARHVLLKVIVSNRSTWPQPGTKGCDVNHSPADEPIEDLAERCRLISRDRHVHDRSQGVHLRLGAVRS